MIGFNQRFDPGCIFVLGAGDDHVGIGAVIAFNRDRILDRVKTGFERVVGVDRRGIQIGKRARKLGRVKFDEFDVFRIFNHVKRADRKTGSRIDLDQAFGLQHQKRTTAIGRIVRNADFGTIFKLAQILDLVGIDAHRGQDVIADHRKVITTILDLVIKVRLVLEAVGLQVAIIKRLVRNDIIREADDFDIKALFGRDLDDLFHDFFVRTRGDADLDFLVRQRLTGQGGGQNGSSRQFKQKPHGKTPCLLWCFAGIQRR